MELLEPVSELQVANLDVYRRILGGEAIVLTIPENIVVSEN